MCVCMCEMSIVQQERILKVINNYLTNRVLNEDSEIRFNKFSEFRMQEKLAFLILSGKTAQNIQGHIYMNNNSISYLIYKDFNKIAVTESMAAMP